MVEALWWWAVFSRIDIGMRHAVCTAVVDCLAEMRNTQSQIAVADLKLGWTKPMRIPGAHQLADVSPPSHSTAAASDSERDCHYADR